MGLGQQAEQAADVVPSQEEGGSRFPSFCAGLVWDLVYREEPGCIHLTVPVWSSGSFAVRIEFSLYIYLVKKEFSKTMWRT